MVFILKKLKLLTFYQLLKTHSNFIVSVFVSFLAVSLHNRMKDTMTFLLNYLGQSQFMLPFLQV